MDLLKVTNLKTHFHTRDGVVKAVDGISFTLNPGEILGVVGESGSGKSAMSLSLMRLHQSSSAYHPEGEVWFEGRDLLTLREDEMQKIRGNEMAMIFQDPMTSLNPVFTIGDQISEVIRAHQQVTRREARDRAIQVLRDVGIPQPEKRMNEYPHQYSGGLRQRAMIAMALACHPKVLIADEPTTALDVTIQAQILELMVSLQQKYGTAIIMITHDLGVVARLADRVMVMYAGKVVEEGSVDNVFYQPAMPYTWSLLRSQPRLDTVRKERLLPIKGQPPSLITLPLGCSFQPRCPFATADCSLGVPSLAVKSKGHQAACILDRMELERQISLATGERR